MPKNSQKQLRRIPQVFSRVLELPLRSHADVLVEDRNDCFRFTANIKNNAFAGQVTAHTVKLHPEVMKVIVTGGNGGGEADKMEVDLWRYRLPETTRPELATAAIVGSELTVRVPKGSQSSGGGKVEDDGRRLIIIH